MKIGKKELAMIVGAIGIIFAVVIYAMVFLPMSEETEALEADNNNLRNRITELEQMTAQVETYQEDTVTMIMDINKVLENFPADSKEEDAILYAKELEARNSNTYISSVGLGDPELLYEIGPTSVPLNAEDEANNESRIFRLYRQKITLANQFTYNGMKQFVTDIVEDSDRRNIETISLAYDRSTGILVGNTEVNLYTLSGTDKEYHPQNIDGINLGISNIFGTIESPVYTENNTEQ